MNVKITERSGIKFAECSKGEFTLWSENDAVGLAGTCGNNETNLVLLFEDNLSDDFYDLKTGVAGKALQKFVNYRIRAAAVISERRIGKGRFYEMLSESNRGSDFRVFGDRDKAIEWLVSCRKTRG